jgi:hypothetical protein
MTHVPAPQGNFISDPDCTTIVLVFVVGTTVPLIWSVCPSATAPNMDPVATAYSKILAFMLPLNPETQRNCKLLLLRSLRANDSAVSVATQSCDGPASQSRVQFEGR